MAGGNKSVVLKPCPEGQDTTQCKCARNAVNGKISRYVNFSLFSMNSTPRANASPTYYFS